MDQYLPVDLLVVDVCNVARACYYVVPATLRTPDNRPVNAVKGFVSCLAAALSQFRPRELVLAGEGRANWRRDLYPEYKANRSAEPEDYAPQVQMIRDLAHAAGWVWLEPDSGEADDMIGAVVTRNAGKRIVIYSSDKDAKALVSDRVTLAHRKSDGSGTLGEIGPVDVVARHGVTPAQMTDYLSIVGDEQDNVPGIDSIGPKTAAKLLAQFGSAGAMFARSCEIKGALRAKVEAGRASFDLSRRLIELDVSHSVPEEMVLPGPERAERLLAALRSLGLSNSPSRLLASSVGPERAPLRTVVSVEPDAPSEEQLSFF